MASSAFWPASSGRERACRWGRIGCSRGGGIGWAAYIIRTVQLFGECDRDDGLFAYRMRMATRRQPAGRPQGAAGRPAAAAAARATTAEARTKAAAGALTLTRTRTKKPSMYKVLMLNDDYTPMEFVVDVLQHIFQKNREEATQIMLHVHQKGVGMCGVYTYEVAETKVTQGGLCAQEPASAAVHAGERVDRDEGVRPFSSRGGSMSMLSKNLEKIPSPRIRARRRAPPRIRDARAPAAGADRGPGCPAGAQGLRRRHRPPAPRPETSSTTADGHHHPERRASRCRPRASSASSSARPPRPVVGPQGSHRRQRAGGAVLRARQPRRVVPREQGMTRLDAVNYISHGIAKVPGRARTRRVTRRGGGERRRGRGQAGQRGAGRLLRRPQREGREGRIDPLIGREHEVERTIQVLCRRTQEQPALCRRARRRQDGDRRGPGAQASSRAKCPRC